ncbi:hypothetical protein BRAO285_1220145 [Bradyrhizobium sp. ORS 285]|nr:hypothetical protein BRAO285_1220145 [Bradyrhizobium sp. ORS 285]
MIMGETYTIALTDFNICQRDFLIQVL